MRSFDRYKAVAMPQIDRADVIKAWEDEIGDRSTVHDVMCFLQEQEPFEAFANNKDWQDQIVHMVYAYSKDMCWFCDRMTYGMYLGFIGQD